MNSQVQLVFDSYLQQILAPKPEVLRFILNHERKPLAIRIACEQIEIAESHAKLRQVFDVSKYNGIIFQCAKMFASFALTNAEQKALSDIEVRKRIAEHNRIQDITAEFAEMEKEVASGKLTSYPGQTAK